MARRRSRDLHRLLVACRDAGATYFGGDYNLIDGQRSDVTFGLPPTQKALDACLEMLEGSNLPWAVAVLGGCVFETGLARRAIERGGHVRVGLEDYAGPGQPSNPELVKQIIDIANDLNRPIADEAQTRAILALPR